jgi:transcriptional regulator with XRE-family HTH domain
MEEIKKLIGLRLKEARRACNMTQEELAKAVGITNGAIGNYETGVSAPNEDILINLMETLHIDANFVYQDFIRPNDYTDEEKHLVALFRGAEPSAREYAFEMLENHQRKTPAITVG